MRYSALSSVEVDRKVLSEEYRSGREIGVIRLGESCLFFRRKLTVYYIPYTEVHRCFRRVMSIPATLCCGKGNFDIEHLVVVNNDNEVAQIQLPGTKAAKILMDELKVKIPNGCFFSPKQVAATEEE